MVEALIRPKDSVLYGNKATPDYMLPSTPEMLIGRILGYYGWLTPEELGEKIYSIQMTNSWLYFSLESRDKISIDDINHSLKFMLRLEGVIRDEECRFAVADNDKGKSWLEGYTNERAYNHLVKRIGNAPLH